MKSNKKIYIFGNPLLPFDNLPIKMLPDLKELFPEIDFIVQDPNENLKTEEGKIIIIDTAQNIDKVTVLNNLDNLETEKIYSAHDFDLAFNLKLLRKIGKLKEVLIFAVPQEIKKQEAIDQLSCLLKDYLKSS